MKKNMILFRNDTLIKFAKNNKKNISVYTA